MTDMALEKFNPAVKGQFFLFRTSTRAISEGAYHKNLTVGSILSEAYVAFVPDLSTPPHIEQVPVRTKVESHHVESY